MWFSDEKQLYASTKNGHIIYDIIVWFDVTTAINQQTHTQKHRLIANHHNRMPISTIMTRITEKKNRIFWTNLNLFRILLHKIGSNEWERPRTGKKKKKRKWSHIFHDSLKSMGTMLNSQAHTNYYIMDRISHLYVKLWVGTVSKMRWRREKWNDFSCSTIKYRHISCLYYLQFLVFTMKNVLFERFKFIYALCIFRNRVIEPRNMAVK